MMLAHAMSDRGVHGRFRSLDSVSCPRRLLHVWLWLHVRTWSIDSGHVLTDRRMSWQWIHDACACHVRSRGTWQVPVAGQCFMPSTTTTCLVVAACQNLVDRQWPCLDRQTHVLAMDT